MENKDIRELFQGTFGFEADRVEKLPAAGSHRNYYRLEGRGKTCIGVYSPDPLETRAFLAFTGHFARLGLNVPELLAEEAGKGTYLLRDLGDLTLKEAVDDSRGSGTFPGGILPLYRKAVGHLVRFQVDGHRGMDYSVCVPRREFDRQSMMWDLNHFKYYFLKLLGVPFDEQALEDDFTTFTRMLSGAEANYFMYRDFQSRNILLFNDELYFVDYQGGRRGALQYDLGSLLFEARADLPAGVREEMLEFYLELLRDKTGIQTPEFMKHYWGFVLIRILQAMGAFGIRGVVENKPLFLQSIPFGIRNIEWLLDNSLLPGGLPQLAGCLERICSLGEWKGFAMPGQGPDNRDTLTVRIFSFSYKGGMPRDLSGNGGGFVFDCRALPNPGREERFRSHTGRDKEVVEFLVDKPEVQVFLDRAFQMVEQSVKEYRSRDFKELMVSFGCTGGQHRSVFCAERLAELLRKRLQVNVLLAHRELETQQN